MQVCLPRKEWLDYEVEVEEAKGLSNKEIAKKVIDDTGMAKALAGGSEKVSGALQPNMEEGELETAIGAGLGGAVGGLPGAALGGAAGHFIGKKNKETDEGLLGTLAGGLLGATTGIPAATAIGGALGHEATKGGSSLVEKDEEETDEGIKDVKNIDWKDVGASTAGGVGGYVAGNAIGGPLAGLAGATVGGAIGSALAKDDQPKDGKLGAVAGGLAGGALTKSAKGAMTGAKLGSALQDKFSKKEEVDETTKCNMSEEGESCPVHGMKECWSATMESMKPQEKAKDPVLERFQQLAAIKCN